MPEDQRFTQLQEQIDELKTGVGALTFPASVETENAIEDAVDRFLKDKVFDLCWRDFFYYSSLCGESVDRYTQTGNGAATVTGSGLYLESGASANDDVVAQLKVSDTINVIQFNKETRFKVTLSKDDVAEAIMYVYTLEDDNGTDYLGFKIDDATIYGLASSGGTESTVALGTYTVDEKITLELRYKPNDQVTFYIQDQNTAEMNARGTLSNNLPVDQAGDKFIFEAYLKTTENSQHTGLIYSWEFIQRR